MKTIIVDVSPTGEVKIDAVGFKGNACQQATAAIERALGKVTSKQFKPEAHTQTQTQTKASR